ncbi:hypothetical protein [Nocardia sp. NPDC057440]|uniref:hypothetical protein n=1 Tax=Nocardia sp. NPDC057440 TaxID=3346134 RepID=UPI0036715AA9
MTYSVVPDGRFLDIGPKAGVMLAMPRALFQLVLFRLSAVDARIGEWVFVRHRQVRAQYRSRGQEHGCEQASIFPAEYRSDRHGSSGGFRPAWM